jgi:hypothetical protein
MRLYIDSETPAVFLPMPDFATYHRLCDAIRKIEGNARTKTADDIRRRVLMYCDAHG